MNVPKVLALTDDEIEALRKEQERALKKFRSRAKLTPEERRLGHAVEMERHHRKTGNKDALAEALGIQGRYAEALEVVVNPKLREVLQTKLEAIEKPDENCSCPDFEYVDGLQIPNLYIESNEIRMGRIMPAIRCRVCNDLNVRPMPHFLAQQRAARAKSVAGQEVRATEFFRER